MKRLSTLLVLLLVVLSLAAQADVSSYVRQLLHRPQVGSSASRRASAEGSPERCLCAFVEVGTADADRVLELSGCRLLAESGGVCIALIPLDRLKELVHHPEIQRIEASPVGHCLMDTTRLVVNALPVYSGSALPQAYSGRGVVMGIVDVGFDLTHPTFLSTDGSHTRIQRFWDQLSADTVGSRLPVGRDFVVPADTVRFSTDRCIETHGTHTAGIAAGSGYDGSQVTLFRGMAPDADLCLVGNVVNTNTVLVDSLALDLYTSATDALAFKYIFDYASSVGQPCVISFSEGYVPTYESDDQLYERFLTSLQGPGRIIVAAAGNNSVLFNYLPKPLGKPSAGDVLSLKPSRSVDIILRTSNTVRFGFDLLSPVAQQHRVRLSEVELGGTGLLDSLSYQASSALFDGSQLYWKYAKYPSSVLDGDTIVHCAMASSGEATWQVAFIVEGAEADAEAWVYGSDFLNDETLPWHDGTVGKNMHCPAAFDQIVAVGSTVHRTGFTNYQGAYKDYSRGNTPGRRAGYSSLGPNIRGRFKPDVCAPGNNIISAYSSFYLEAKPDARDIQSDVVHFPWQGRTYSWNANTGTSMAAPVVGGAVALWLEAVPDLTPAGVIDVLSHCCRQPDEALDYPNNQYGYGEIDVYKGLLYLLGIDAVPGLSSSSPSAVSLSLLSGGRLQVSFPDTDFPDAVNLRVYDLQGCCQWQSVLQPVSAVSTVRLPLPPGVYAVQVDGPTSATTGSTLIRLRQ